MGDRMLIRAVVVHLPDFFLAAAGAHEKYLALGDSGYASAKTEDNFISKFVRDRARRDCGGAIGVLLAENLRRIRGALDVVKPPLHLHLVGGDSQIAERQHRSTRRRRTPLRRGQFGWLPRNLFGIKALRDELENPCIVKIVPQCFIEHFQQFGVFWILGRWLEVGCGEAYFFDTQSGAGANPVLGRTAYCREEHQSEDG